MLTTNTFGANRVAPGEIRPGRQGPRHQLRRGRPRPASGRRRRPPRAGGRLDRPLAPQPPYDGAGRGDDRRAGRGPAGRRGRFHHVRDAAHPGRPRAVRGRHAPPGRRALHPLSPSWRQANRSPASRSNTCSPRLPDGCPQPIAWGMNCGTGPDGLLGAVERAVRVARSRWWSSPTPASPRKSITGGSTSARPNT